MARLSAPAGVPAAGRRWEGAQVGMSSVSVRGVTQETPGTYRISDHSAVVWHDAIAAWSGAAREVLLRAAHRYGAVVTYKELGEEAQAAAGIRTRSLLMNWIGQVLEEVAARCAAEDEVVLTALCVHQDGTVGDGYAGAVERYGGGRPSDPELHAADARLDCYRKYATDLPPDGGRARLTPQEQARRKAAAPPAAELKCSVHNTVLPRSGQCDDCA